MLFHRHNYKLICIRTFHLHSHASISAYMCVCGSLNQYWLSCPVLPLSLSFSLSLFLSRPRIPTQLESFHLRGTSVYRWVVFCLLKIKDLLHQLSWPNRATRREKHNLIVGINEPNNARDGSALNKHTLALLLTRTRRALAHGSAEELDDEEEEGEEEEVKEEISRGKKIYIFCFFFMLVYQSLIFAQIIYTEISSWCGFLLHVD